MRKRGGATGTSPPPVHLATGPRCRSRSGATSLAHHRSLTPAGMVSRLAANRWLTCRCGQRRHWVAVICDRGTTKARSPRAPCHFQGIAERGSCGKAPVVPQTSRPGRGKRGVGHVRRDHRRKRADRPDAGGRAGVGGGRCRDPRAAFDAGPRRHSCSRVPLTNDRDLRPARHRRPVPRRGTDGPGAELRRHPAERRRLPLPAPLHAGAGAEPHRADPARLGRGAGRAGSSRARGHRLRPGRRRRRRPPRRGRAAPNGVPGRGRWRAQCHPQGGRHRLRRSGGDPEPPDRRGRGDRGDAHGHPARRRRHPCDERDGGRADRGDRRDRAAARTRQRADPGGPQRSTDGRVRHGLRDPRPEVDLEVHRRHAAGSRLPQWAGAARRRRRAHPSAHRRAGDRPRRAGRGQPRLEARPGRPGRLTRRPPGQLPRGAAPRHGPSPEERDGPSRSSSEGTREPRQCATRSPTC